MTKLDRRRGAFVSRKHATVHTATVDLKIIRLDGKQVTQSVFKQIPMATAVEVWEPRPNSLCQNRRLGRSWIAPRLAGVPWGVIRHTFPSDPKWATCHILWQYGDQLRRMPYVLCREWEERHRDSINDQMDHRRCCWLFTYIHGDSGPREWEWYGALLTGDHSRETLEKLLKNIQEFFWSLEKSLDQLFIAV